MRRGGEDEAEVRWLNVETRRELPDSLPRARYFGVAVKPDKSGFYYCRHGKDGSRVFYHPMGTDFAADMELFGKGYSADKGIGIALSEDGHYLLMTVFYGSAAEKTELYLLDTHQGTAVGRWSTMFRRDSTARLPATTFLSRRTGTRQIQRY